MANYKELRVWHLAMELVELIYLVTLKFPQTEKYGLVSQMRRAAVSIPSNIAEGRSMGSDKQMLRFSSIAQGSIAELETQIEIAAKQAMMEESEKTQLLFRCSEIARMLHALTKTCRSA